MGVCQQDEEIIPGQDIRSKISEFYKNIKKKINKLSKTSKNEEINIYFNTIDGRIWVSVGDWVKTDFKDIEKLIKNEIKNLYKQIDFKINNASEIQIECEFRPKGREWIHIRDWDEDFNNAEKKAFEKIDKEYGGD